MIRAINIIIVGAIIASFNLYIGGFNLLPAFLGYLLIGIGASQIKQDGKLSISKILPLIFALYQFVLIFIRTSECFTLIQSLFLVAFMTADMVMCFYILQDFIDITESIKVMEQQKAYLVLTTVCILISCFIINIPKVEIWVAIIGVIYKLYFILIMFGLKKDIRICNDLRDIN